MFTSISFAFDKCKLIFVAAEIALNMFVTEFFSKAFFYIFLIWMIEDSQVCDEIDEKSAIFVWINRKMNKIGNWINMNSMTLNAQLVIKWGSHKYSDEILWQMIRLYGVAFQLKNSIPFMCTLHSLNYSQSYKA